MLWGGALSCHFTVPKRREEGPKAKARNGGRRARSAAEPQSDRWSPKRFAPPLASLRKTSLKATGTPQQEMQEIQERPCGATGKRHEKKFYLPRWHSNARDGHGSEAVGRTVKCQGPCVPLVSSRRIGQASTRPGGIRTTKKTGAGPWSLLCFLFYGGGKESRTPDLLNAIQTLYQLSYTPEKGMTIRYHIPRILASTFFTKSKKSCFWPFRRGGGGRREGGGFGAAFAGR